MSCGRVLTPSARGPESRERGLLRRGGLRNLDSPRAPIKKRRLVGSTRDDRSAQNRARSAACLDETSQPVGAGGEDYVANAGDEGVAGSYVGVAEGAIAHQGLDAAPFATCGDARIELPSRFVGVWASAPLLSQDCAAPHHLNTGESAVGGHRLLERANAQVDHRGEFFLREILESSRSGERKGDDVWHSALIAKEVTWSRCDESLAMHERGK